jgi:hypothetical protein
MLHSNRGAHDEGHRLRIRPEQAVRGAGHEVRTRTESEHETPGIQPDHASDEATESPQLSTVRDEPRPLETAGRAEPLTLDLLRRKLDAAIVAEAWEAVRAIRERIVEVERSGVIDLARERARLCRS